MEINAYNELKSARNSARAIYRPLSDAERSLKSAIFNLNGAGETEMVEALVEIRANVRTKRIAAQANKEALEAQVTAARQEYRQAKVNAALAGFNDPDESDAVDWDADSDDESDAVPYDLTADMVGAVNSGHYPE